jgi:hypothetical protein
MPINHYWMSLLFLVTNRHVVVDEGKNYHPNAIILRLHTNQNDLRQNIEYNIHLHKGISSMWRNPNSIAADVVAIQIDIDDFNRQGIICKSFASNNLLPNDIQLNVAEDVFVMWDTLWEFMMKLITCHLHAAEQSQAPILFHGMEIRKKELAAAP